MLDAAGEAARAISTISWVLVVGGLAIFAGVMALLAWSCRDRPGTARAGRWIVGGGLVFPGVVLAALYAWTMPLAPVGKPVPPPGALMVAIQGHLWWWEVRYTDPATGAEILTANELRIPVGRPVHLALSSRDVIHSFWVPPLAGKMDLVPGRMNHLLLSADRPGTWRAACAEFCGEQHARMAMQVVALEPAAFDAWLAAQAGPAAAPATPRQARGQQVFLAQRCDACHQVRGVGGASRLGPDLTHVGSRAQLAAGTLVNSQAERERWIAHVQQVKPGARMPSYGERLDPEALAALADWLGALQ